MFNIIKGLQTRKWKAQNSHSHILLNLSNGEVLSVTKTEWKSFLWELDGGRFIIHEFMHPTGNGPQPRPLGKPRVQEEKYK